MTKIKNALSNLLGLIPRLPYREDTVFSLTLFLFLFLPLIFIPVIEEGFETPKMAFFLIALGTIIFIWAYKKLPIYNLPKYVQVTVGLFALTIIVTTIFSLDIRNSLLGLMGRTSNSAVFLLGWIALIYLLVSSLTKDKLLVLSKVVILGGFLIAVYSLLQQEGIGFYDSTKVDHRVIAPSFLGNPNFNSMYLAMVVPLGLYFIAKSKKFWQRNWYILATFMMIWGLAQTSSRAAILALIVALGALFVQLLLSKDFGILFKSTAVAIVLTILLAFLSINVYRPNNIAESLQFQEYTQQSRFVVWDMTLNMIMEHPWLGTGLSNYFIDFHRYGWSTFSYGERFDDPHNVFLLLAANGGLVMVFSFAVLLGIGCYLGWKQRHTNQFAAVWVASLVAWSVAASFGPVVTACWLLLALALAAIFYQYRTKPLSINLLPIRGAMFAIGPLFAALGIALISSYVLLHISKQYYDSKDYQNALKFAEWGQLWDVANSRVNNYLLRSRVFLNLPAEETEALMLRTIDRRSNSAPVYVSSSTMYYHLWKQTNDERYLLKMDGTIEQALLREPGYANTHLKFAYLYYMSGNLEQALFHQRLALTYSNDQFFSWVLLSKIYYDLNQREQFLFAYEKAAELNQETFLIRGTLQLFRETQDIQSIPYPVHFPEPE